MNPTRGRKDLAENKLICVEREGIWNVKYEMPLKNLNEIIE